MTTKAIQAALTDPATHYQLREAIIAFANMDPVDAANDAETLARLFVDAALAINTRALAALNAGLCGCGAPATHYTRHGSPVCHTCADGIEQSYIRNRNEPYQEPRPIQR